MTIPNRPISRRPSLVGLALILSLIGNACTLPGGSTPTASVSPPTETQPTLEAPLTITLTGATLADLVDSEWRLADIPGQQIPPEGGHATLEIQADRIGGYSGCNWYGGATVATATGFQWGQPIITARACAPDLMTLESEFTERYQQATAWHVEDTRLELRDSSGAALLVLERRQPADVTASDLVGRWVWSGETAASTLPWIAFDGARFSGNTGCRDFSGDYTTERDRLHFGTWGMQSIDCSVSGATPDIEAPVMEALDSVTYYRLDQGALILETTTGTLSRWERASDATPTVAPGDATSVPEPGAQTIRVTGTTPAGLANSSWTLTGLTAGPTLSDVQVTLTIDSNVISGSSGCNNYGGDYAASGSDLVVQPLYSTLMLCPEPAGSIETAYLAAFRAADEWRISGAALEFRDAAGAVLATFAAAASPAPTPIPAATVVPAPTVAPLPTLSPTEAVTPTVVVTPTISSFTVSPTTAERGQSLTLTWASTNGLTATLEHRDPNNWWGTRIPGDYPLSGQTVISDTTKDEGVTAFILTVYGEGGGWAQQEVTVRFPCLYAFFFTDRDLGACPLGEARTLSMVEQNFEHGIMVWFPHQTGGTILVLYDSGRIGTFTDTWTEGQPESDPTIVPPADFFAPTRGFGKVWREQPGVRDALGWAYWPETPVSSMTQARSTGGDWKAIDYYFKIVDGRIVHITGRTMPGGWEFVEP